MAIRLPNSPPIKAGDPTAHSDGACYNRWRLQATCYLADVPPASGAFTVWPGSHKPIWAEQWAAFGEGERHSMFRDGGAPVPAGLDKASWRSGGYVSPEIAKIKQNTEPVDCHGAHSGGCQPLSSCT